MADTLKVFKNEVAVTTQSSNGTVPIGVFTTNGNTKAVIKDLAFIVEPTNERSNIAYTYPTKLLVDGFPVTPILSGKDLRVQGSQIVDINSTVTAEIQSENSRQDFGIMEIIVPDGSSSSAHYRFDLARFDDPSDRGAELLTAAIKNKTVLPRFNGNTGCTIVRNGEVQFSFANGSQLRVVRSNGTDVATLAMSTQTFAICADDTFIYGKDTTANTTIYRWNIDTLTPAANLVLNNNISGFPSANPGFIDHYDGEIFYRATGGDTAVRRINTTTGNVTTISLGTQSEHLGGLITVNTSGIPFIVEYQDTQYRVTNLDTLNSSTYPPIFPTDPTTTQGNHAAVIANGIVMFNNGSYNTVAIIDVNGSAPVGTLVTTQFPLGALNGAMISRPFKNVPPAIPREIIYSLFASGVESTN